MNNPFTTIRRRLNLKRTALAKESGMSYHTLTALELGKPDSVTHKTAKQFATFAGVDVYPIIQEYEEWKGVQRGT